VIAGIRAHKVRITHKTRVLKRNGDEDDEL
jgi:hypothetical protein